MERSAPSLGLVGRIGSSERWMRLAHSGGGRAGFVIVCALVLVTVAVALGLLPYEPTEQHPSARLTGPSGDYWFGTDQFGRDIASRVLAGIGASLRVSILAVAISVALGTFLGTMGGYAGGRLDALVTRLADIVFAFPGILLALAIVTALGTGWFNTAVAIGIVYVPIFVRVARGPVLSVKDADYVRAARGLGFSTGRILFRHVLPNVTAPIIVQAALALGWAILTEAGLSFLGLGTQPPEPSLGLMVSDARTLALTAWWTLLAPAGGIMLAVIGFNLLGDGLRDALDPTMRVDQPRQP
ncbi:MAG: ABC transporter permease [Actinomycetota bacterium]